MIRQPTFCFHSSFNLERRVGDAEPVFEIVRSLFKENIARTSAWHHKMNRQRIRCSAERPDMKIMQINDAWERA